MDFLTQQFIAASKKLREQIDVLGKYILLLHRDSQEQLNATRETRDAYQESHDSPQILRAELQVPKPIEVKTEPKDKKQCREWFKLIVETLTLGAVVWYTIIANHQWHEMISARHQTKEAIEAANRSAAEAKNANEIARRGSRPFAGIESITPTYYFPPRGTSDIPRPDTNAMSVQVVIKNFGPLPALNFNSYMDVFFNGVKQKGTRKVPHTP